MWKLQRITATDLCAFRELDYTLRQGRTTLIFGNNLDNDSQGSNGSGKSALLEAIAIALTGEPMRKVKMEEIINDAATEATVTADLTNASAGTELHIERRLSRKRPQTIKVSVKEGGKETDVERPSVAEYNSYILEAIGLDKDDLYSNYVLSKSKYVSFLACSDRDKKEIINRFSNGNMVDDAIAALKTDGGVVCKRVLDGQTQVAVAQGKVDTVNEQIERAEADMANKAQRREARLKELEESIVRMRGERREALAAIRELDEKREDILKTAKEVETIKAKDEGLAQSYQELEKAAPGLVKDYALQAAEYSREIQLHKETLQLRKADLDRMTSETDDLMKKRDQAAGGFKEFEKMKAETEQKVGKQMEDITRTIQDSKAEGRRMEEEYRTVLKSISELERSLMGAIQCPNCHHEFVAGKDVDVAEARGRVKAMKEAAGSLNEAIDKAAADIEKQYEQEDKLRGIQRMMGRKAAEWDENMARAERAVSSASEKAAALGRKISGISDSIADIERKVGQLRDNMFYEAEDTIDRLLKDNEKAVRDKKRVANMVKGDIECAEESIQRLREDSDTDVTASLKELREGYLMALKEASDALAGEKAELARYTEQEQVFMEFKTWLANTKIEALNHITNSFLEAIDSDIRISLSGYTLLKSGKIRDKISISLLRDGKDCGSFDKFSAGERARVELACVLAMNRLTNTSCDTDKGLDLLVLDEILEAVDEQGLASIFEALNRLGITSLVVSHGNVAEGYPYRTIVTKQNGVSFIKDAEH